MPSTSNQNARESPYYVKALAIGIIAFLLGAHLSSWVQGLGLSLAGRADFRHLYTAGYMLRTGHGFQLYDLSAQLRFQNALVSPGDIPLPFNHLAYEALLFVPLSWLSYREAFFVFLAVNVALLVLCYRLLLPQMQNLRQMFPWLPAGLFLGFLPVGATLIQGQDSILLLTLFAGALVLLEQGLDVWAGILIGAGLFKFQIVLPIALLFLAWQRFRLAAGFALSAMAAAAVSVGLVGFGQMVTYGHALVSMSIYLTSAADRFQYATSPNEMGNLRGLLSELGSFSSARSVQVCIVATSAIVFLLAADLGLKQRKTKTLLLIALTTASLVSYHFLMHDMSVLLIPILVLLNDFVEAESTSDAHGRMIFRMAALLFVCPICTSYAPQHSYLVCLPLLGLLFGLLRYSSNEAVVRHATAAA